MWDPPEEPGVLVLLGEGEEGPRGFEVVILGDGGAPVFLEVGVELPGGVVEVLLMLLLEAFEIRALFLKGLGFRFELFEAVHQ